MTTTRGSSQAGNLLRGVFLFLLIALMLLLVFLTLRSLFFIPSSTAPTDADAVSDAGAVSDGQSSSGTSTDADGDAQGDAAPAGPAVVVPLDGNATAEGGVACGRPVGAAQGDPFRIQVDDPSGSDEDLAIGVALLIEDGQRSPRQVSLPATETGGVRQVTVPDSGDAVYRSCVITAIQRGERVILTGQ